MYIKSGQATGEVNVVVASWVEVRTKEKTCGCLSANALFSRDSAKICELWLVTYLAGFDLLPCSKFHARKTKKLVAACPERLVDSQRYTMTAIQTGVSTHVVMWITGLTTMIIPPLKYSLPCDHCSRHDYVC